MYKPIPRQYFKTVFSSEENITHWPIHFAILKATDLFCTDHSHGGSIPAKSMGDYLKENYSWVRRLIANDTHNSKVEEYWAVAIGWHEACNLAQSSGLEAIFYVSDNSLSVTYCDDRRKPIFVDGFLKRFRKQR